MIGGTLLHQNMTMNEQNVLEYKAARPRESHCWYLFTTNQQIGEKRDDCYLRRTGWQEGYCLVAGVARLVPHSHERGGGGSGLGRDRGPLPADRAAGRALV